MSTNQQALSTSLPPPPASTHAIARSQIRAQTHQIIQDLLRQSLTIQERDSHLRRCLESGAPVIFDEVSIAKRVNSLFDKKRRQMLKQSYLYDRIFYMKANTMEEYYDVSTLERRVLSLGQIFVQRARARDIRRLALRDQSAARENQRRTRRRRVSRP
ncbi:hypothetical protein HJC23_012024 [Cyclotella cryptica]|uniref:Uncharacterized protein n=1 Tax=Cyclotella cryptica TaxID=29204 RepID=A0ABD3NCF5_9STRA